MKELLINGEKVDARALWESLESRRQFSDWAKNRLADFIEGTDYTAFNRMSKRGTKATKRKNYLLSLNTAERICLREHKSKGGEIYQYLIEAEKQQNFSDALANRTLTAKVAGPINITEEREMKELLKLDENGNRTVSARNLHMELGVRRDFSNWIKDRIEKYGFVEGEDYQKAEDLSSPNLVSSKARPQKLINYYFTLSAAKELAMVENNEAGRRIRQYLIDFEEKNRKPAIPDTMSDTEAGAMAVRVIEHYRARFEQEQELRIEAEKKLALAAPKATFYDQMTLSEDTFSMREAVAIINRPG
jgi:phage anti-repressor protein